MLVCAFLWCFYKTVWSIKVIFLLLIICMHGFTYKLLCVARVSDCAYPLCIHYTQQWGYTFWYTLLLYWKFKYLNVLFCLLLGTSDKRIFNVSCFGVFTAANLFCIELIWDIERSSWSNLPKCQILCDLVPYTNWHFENVAIFSHSYTKYKVLR